MGRHARAVLILIFIASFCQTGLQGVTGLYVVDKFSLNSTQMGIVWTALAAALVVAQGVWVGFLTDRIQEKTPVGIGLISGAACLFALTVPTLN